MPQALAEGNAAIESRPRSPCRDARLASYDSRYVVSGNYWAIMGPFVERKFAPVAR